jgi:hypothetical protein
LCEEASEHKKDTRKAEIKVKFNDTEVRVEEEEAKETFMCHLLSSLILICVEIFFGRGRKGFAETFKV